MSALPNDACGVCLLSRGPLRTVCFVCRSACAAACRALVANLAVAAGLCAAHGIGLVAGVDIALDPYAADLEQRTWYPGCHRPAPGVADEPKTPTSQGGGA